MREQRLILIREGCAGVKQKSLMVVGGMMGGAKSTARFQTWRGRAWSTVDVKEQRVPFVNATSRRGSRESRRTSARRPQCLSCEKWRSARAILVASNPRKWLLTATIGLSDRLVGDSAKTSMHVKGV